MRAMDLPLLFRTAPSWAEGVLRQPLELLNDHAWLEKKAAAGALDLLNRWPEPNPPVNWVAAMTSIARDEVKHLGSVCRLLARRGGRLTRQHRCQYAGDLRLLVRKGRGPEELADRLLVSALIEARSCERFALLGEATGDAALQKLYRELWGSEHGHFRTFLDLAGGVLPEAAVTGRWNELLAAEARIIQAQPPGPRIHSGMADVSR